VGALAALIAFGLLLGRRPEAIEANFTDFWRGADQGWLVIKIVGVAMVGALFSSDAWNNVTFTAGETRNPQRNLPLSLAVGVGLVSILYFLCNLVYLMALPIEGIMNAPEDRVATAVMEQMMGGGAVQLMAAAVMVSTSGCVNGMVLAGARVYFAMARDGLFFKAVGKVDARRHAPVTSLWVQCLWACLLTLTGRYSDLLDYVIFAVLLFYILTIVGLFVLRRRRPGMERPYRAIGYPVLPAIYVVAASVIEVLLLLFKPSYTWPGLILVTLGIPVYFIWQRKAKENEV
jgi:basic amino acid/polyamine antiporter, APA family